MLGIIANTTMCHIVSNIIQKCIEYIYLSWWHRAQTFTGIKKYKKIAHWSQVRLKGIV